MGKIFIVVTLFLSVLAFADIPKSQDLGNVYSQALDQHQATLAIQQEDSLQKRKGQSPRMQRALDKRFATQLRKHGIALNDIVKTEDLPTRDGGGAEYHSLFGSTVAHTRIVETKSQVCRVTLEDTASISFGRSRLGSVDCEKIPSSN